MNIKTVLTHLPIIPSLFFAIILGGCSTKVALGPAATTQIAGAFAVLPVQAESDISREKLTYLQESFSRELSLRGYAVLSDQTVNSVCSTQACPEKASIAKLYDVKNFLAVQLSGARQTNLIAGYYNSLSGTVKVITPSDNEIVAVTHTESEKGGALLNTGQLLEVFKSAKRGFKDSSRELADRFAQHVIAKIPPPATREMSPSTLPVELRTVEIHPLGDSKYRVCAEGTPGNSGSLLINRTRYALRELKPGSYCNVILASFAAQNNAAARTESSSILLESPFGATARRDFMLPDSAFCDPYTVLYRDTAASITFGCKDPSGDCSAAINSCKKSDFYVYRAQSEAGPFAKIGKIVGQNFKEMKEHSPEEHTYSVLAIYSDGVTSTPIEVK